MTEPFNDRLQNELTRRRREKLLREISVFSDCRLNLSSNDYFQLRFHPQVVAAANRAAEAYGAGSGASPLLSGFLPCHDQLLRQLMEWKQKPAGMLFNTGFLANQAVMKHLPGKKDLVLADRLAHHSILQGLTAGTARFKRYNHLDLDHLEELLAKNQGRYESVFVVTETVFSMDGDYPDLKKLVALKEKFLFILILDEAHGTGVFGPTGGGLAEEMGVLERVDILVGTLGKALASMGAYVLTRSPLIVEYLINTAGEFIYSTFLSPSQAGAASAALKILRQAHDKRRFLHALSKTLRQGLRESGWSTNTFDTPIVPVIVGDADKALELRGRLLERGILTGAVRPPTVPPGSSRLRISLHSDLTEESLQDLLGVLGTCKR